MAATYHESSIIGPRWSVDTIFEVSDVGGLKERLEADREAPRRGSITRTHRAAATLRDAVRGDAPCRRSFRL